MTSEADLDSDIKSLSVLSEHPELFEEFSKLGCVASLVSLLSHENTDIAIDAIQTIVELTDEDVQAEQEQWDSLVNAMVWYGPKYMISYHSTDNVAARCRCHRTPSAESGTTR
jgi:hypothetical protein